MSDSEGESKALLSCPMFTGEYLPWKRQFMLFASVKGFKEAVSKKPDPNLPAEEEELFTTDPVQLEREKVAIKKNCLAMNQLYQAFRKKVVMRLLQSTCSDEWPSGKDYEVIKKLNKKICPTDSIASLQAETDLAAIKMSKNEDPSEFHDKLYEVKQRYPNAISEQQVRNAMIRQCRKEYTEDVVKAMSLPRSTTEDLLAGMMNRFRCIHTHCDSEDSDDEDVALVAAFQ